MKGKWSAGKIAAIICGSAAAAIVLLVSLFIGVFQLAGRIRAASDIYESYQQANDHAHEDYDYNENDYGYDYGYDYDDSEYYEFHDEIGENLSYWAEFETRDKVLGENENILLNIVYPVFYSEENDLTGVNSAAQKELAEIENYLYSVSEWLSESDEFTFEAKGYVTYMDEEILSIAYVEYGYLNGEFYESYVISSNIDMNSKMALTNSQLLNIDDEFSIDFRKRCEEQNGEIESLYYYSDQDITEMLTSEDSLIIFYTPLGMEVGFNYYYGWVTVTYQDYQKYQRKF